MPLRSPRSSPDARTAGKLTISVYTPPSEHATASKRCDACESEMSFSEFSMHAPRLSNSANSAGLSPGLSAKGISFAIARRLGITRCDLFLDSYSQIRCKLALGTTNTCDKASRARLKIYRLLRIGYWRGFSIEDL